MIIVTGGAGFIGSNIVKGLNDAGRTDILVVDDLADGKKCLNLADLKIADYVDMNDFLRFMKDGGALPHVDYIFHQGACSTTTEWNGKLVMGANFDYSKAVLDWAQKRSVPMIYASSASVYGISTQFAEEEGHECPVNVYAYSKHLFDQYVRNRISNFKTSVIGLRYFNVYGPREQHKGSQSSVAYHFWRQLQQRGEISLFEGSGGYGNGEQQRDFIYVDDVVKINLWFAEKSGKSGIFNCGTGVARTFNDVARSVIKCFGRGCVSYVPFPDGLRGSYQSYTKADISQLKSAGFSEQFTDLEFGIGKYVEWMSQKFPNL